MPGNADVHDEVLARAAAGGDRDAFATLFERHLRSVFEAAWFVLHDRAVAAEIARDTFAAAWQHAGAVEPAAFAGSLVESAEHKATAWLNENPQALATANAPVPDESPGIGPVLRARIVTALEIHGIPTKARGDGKPAELLDLGPRRDGRERVAQRFSGLLAGRARLGLVGAAAAVLLVGGVVVISDGAGGSSADDDDIETAAADEDPGSESVRDVPWRPSAAVDDEDEEDEDPTSSTTSSTTTTATDGASTTETSDTTDEPPSTSRPRPTTTVRPSNPPATTPTTTTTPRPPTTPAPTQPTIYEFTARRDGKCQDGREWVVFTWRATQATWAWIWPSNAPDPWQDLPGMSGSTGRCSWPGERWNLSIRRQSDGREVWKTITV